VDGLQSFKHDFNNIIQVIDGYLKLNNIEGLREYYSQIQGEVRQINNILPLNSYVKNFPPLYGLLLSKISYAELKNITFNINILSDIDIKNIKTLDFCKVIGILLDNALEAAEQSEERKVDFDIKKVNHSFKIEIRNTFIGNIDLEKVFDSGFTSKKEHTGFGLFEVKNILKKYNNISLNTSIYENTFIHRLNIR